MPSIIMIIFLISSFVVLFKCHFLSIKLPKETGFIPITTCERAFSPLKVSLIEAVMNQRVEIIISRSTQVKFAKRLVKSNQNYPQWKLIALVYRGIYDGIHIVKQDGHLIINSLSFEANNSIPFLIDTSWSMQINEYSKFSMITFSGPSINILNEIANVLFKSNCKIRFFKTCSLFVEKSYIVDGSTSAITEKKMEKLKAKHSDSLYFIEKNTNNSENTQIVHFSEQVIGSKPLKSDRICVVNGVKCSSITNALDAIKSSLIDSKFINIYVSPDDPHDSVMGNIMSEVPLFIKLEDFDSEKLLETFRNVIGKVIFESSISIPFIISYDADNKIAALCYENGAFSISIQAFLHESLEKHKIVDKLNSNHGKLSTIKIEDHHGHSFQYYIPNLLLHSSHVSLFRSMKRILLSKNNKFSFEAKVVKTMLIEELSSPSMDDFLFKIKENIEKILFNDEHQNTQMMEIIFDRDNDKIIINSLEIKEPEISILLVDARSFNFKPEIYNLWRLLIVDTGSKVTIGEGPVTSWEIPFYFWKSISKEFSITIKKYNITLPIDSSLSYSSKKGGTIEIKGLDENLSLLLIELLLSTRLMICEIYEFRLKHGFRIDIDIGDSNHVNKLLEFINFNLKFTITYKFEQNDDSVQKSDMMISPFADNNNTIAATTTGGGSDHHRYRKRNDSMEMINIKKDLLWKKAIELVVADSPSILAMPFFNVIQVMERMKNQYHLGGNLEIVYYYNKFDIKSHIKSKDQTQIVRIGKSKNHNIIDNEKFSFLFIQYAINKNIDAFESCHHHANHSICSVDIRGMSKMSDILGMIISIYRSLDRNIKGSSPQKTMISFEA